MTKRPRFDQHTLATVGEPVEADEMREFLIVLRRALLLIVEYVERRYGLPARKH